MNLWQFFQNLLRFDVFIVLESVILMTVFLYVFHGRVLSKRMNDYKAYQIHFIAVFALFFIVPFITLLAYGKNPMDFGLKIGDWRTGLIAVGIGIVFAVITGLTSAPMKDMQLQYPFSKEALDSPKKFVLFESMYFFFYYTGWEFLFRGVLLFALISIDPMLAILVQVIPSVLLHIGHPAAETVSSIFAGLMFGFLAYYTGSILYPLLIHASVGITLDTMIYFKNSKTGSE